MWTPIALGLGCAAYLSLRDEPAPAVLQLILAASLAIFVAVRRIGVGRMAELTAIYLAFAAVGACAASLRTQLIASPLAASGVTSIEGWVVDVDSPGATGGRVLLAPYRMGDITASDLPRRVRISLGEAGIVGPGAAIRVRAIVNPPPGPAAPGAYDFARDAFFKGVGGVGFALTEPEATVLPTPPPGLRIRMAINSARWSLAQRIADAAGPRAAGMAAAMVTGHEAWMDEQTEEALRDSGLAHLISISGVHMALVGGFVFFLVRLAVAAWPWLAVRAPGKKIAAVAGLFAVAIYLVVSGAPPPAVRAAVTLSVAFVAVLADRQAITLRALALAALIVLLIQPEAVAQPGFQMSFCATAALLALAEAWPRSPREIDVPLGLVILQRAPRWLAAAVAASLVAGMATGPFAMQHFNRVALYGLPANLLSEPISAFVIMPFLALGAVCAALGLPNPFLAIAGWGVERLTDLGAWFATLPGATATVASAPNIALPVAFVGVLWVCIWKGWGRWLGVPAACAVLLWPRPEPPAVWIASDGGAAAIVRAGQAVSLRPDAKAFAFELWARRRGLEPVADIGAAAAAGYVCNRTRCLPEPSASPALAAWWTKRPPRSAEFAEACDRAEIIVTKRPAAGPCRALVLDGAAFAHGGAVELRRGEGGWRALWANDLRGRRPWTVNGSGG